MNAKSLLGGAALLALGLGFAGPAAADEFVEACMASTDDSQMGTDAVEQYCNCLGNGVSDNPQLANQLLEILAQPREERRASIQSTPGAGEVIVPCVQQMRGG